MVDNSPIKERYDFIIIGSGIGGASIAYELASRNAQVLVLESEALPGYHTSGRSAAFYMAAYGNEVVRSITIASRSFYERPPVDFSEYPLLRSSGAMYIARDDQLKQLHEMYEQVRKRLPQVELIDRNQVLAKVPQLKPDYISAGFWEPTSMEIDVASLLQGYIKLSKRLGADFVFTAPVTKLQRQSTGWIVETPSASYRGDIIVNAAGAWGDTVAALAGATPVGLVPKRRTVCIAKSPKDVDPSQWPLTIDIDEQFYFKPDAGNILITPADETPMAAMDVFPDELDIALGIERFQKAMNIQITHVTRSWAGLRTFVADKSPVVGFDTQTPGFFWLVGQGGYGMQMAPALAKTAASLALKEQFPVELSAMDLDLEKISPARYQ